MSPEYFRIQPWRFRLAVSIGMKGLMKNREKGNLIMSRQKQLLKKTSLFKTYNLSAGNICLPLIPCTVPPPIHNLFLKKEIIFYSCFSLSLIHCPCQSLALILEVGTSDPALQFIHTTNWSPSLGYHSSYCCNILWCDWTANCKCPRHPESNVATQRSTLSITNYRMLRI